MSDARRAVKLEPLEIGEVADARRVDFRIENPSQRPWESARASTSCGCLRAEWVRVSPEGDELSGQLLYDLSRARAGPKLDTLTVITQPGGKRWDLPVKSTMLPPPFLQETSHVARYSTDAPSAVVELEVSVPILEGDSKGISLTSASPWVERVEVLDQRETPHLLELVVRAELTLNTPAPAARAFALQVHRRGEVHALDVQVSLQLDPGLRIEPRRLLLARPSGGVTTGTFQVLGGHSKQEELPDGLAWSTDPEVPFRVEKREDGFHFRVEVPDALEAVSILSEIGSTPVRMDLVFF